MNSLDARLIELQHLLISRKYANTPEQMSMINSQIQHVCHSDDDIINVNIGSNQQGEQGPPGPQGEKGEQGEQGPPGQCSCNTILISEDYSATTEDCYIGVNSDGPVTILLPENDINGHIIIIKAEMNPPLGNRKVTIKTSDGSKIDGKNKLVITVSYTSITFLYRDGLWFTI